jgi:hypothetical protein
MVGFASLPPLAEMLEFEEWNGYGAGKRRENSGCF